MPYGSSPVGLMPLLTTGFAPPDEDRNLGLPDEASFLAEQQDQSRPVADMPPFRPRSQPLQPYVSELPSEEDFLAEQAQVRQQAPKPSLYLKPGETQPFANVADDNMDLVKQSQQLLREYDTDNPAKATGRYFADRSIPGFSSGKQLGSVAAAKLALDKLDTMPLSLYDATLLARYLNDHEDDEKRAQEPGFWGGLKRAGNIAAEVPAFAGELYATGGLGTAARKAAQRYVVSKLGQKLAARTAARAVGVAARTAAQTNLMPQRIAKTAIERKRQHPDESWTEAMAHSEFQNLVEVGTEVVGGRIINRAAQKFVIKPIGKVATELAKRTPVLDPIRKALLDAWVKLKPGRSLQQAYEKVAKAGGWDGLLGEVGEERMNEIILGTAGALGATGQEYADFGATGKLASGKFGEAYDALWPELLAFAAPGAALKVAGASVGYFGLGKTKQQKIDEYLERPDSERLYRQAVAAGMPAMPSPLSPNRENRINHAKAIQQAAVEAAQLTAEQTQTEKGGDPNGQVQEVRQGELQVQVPQVESGPNAELEDFLSSAESDLSNANEGTDAEAAGGPDVPIGPAAVSSSPTTSGRSPDAVAEQAAESVVSSSPAAAIGGTVAASSPVPSLDAPDAERQAGNANLGGDEVTTPASETSETAKRGAIPTESAGTQRNPPAPRTETVAEATKRLDDRYNELVASGKTPLEALQTIQAEGQAEAASKVSPPATPPVVTQEKPNAVPTESPTPVAKPVAKEPTQAKLAAPEVPTGDRTSPEAPRRNEEAASGRREYASEIEALPPVERVRARRLLNALREAERELDDMRIEHNSLPKETSAAKRERSKARIDATQKALDAEYENLDAALRPDEATDTPSPESQNEPETPTDSQTNDLPSPEIQALYDEHNDKLTRFVERQQETQPGDWMGAFSDWSDYFHGIGREKGGWRTFDPEKAKGGFLAWAKNGIRNRAKDIAKADHLRQAGETEDGTSVLDNLADRASQAHDEVREAFRDFGRSFGAGTFGSTGFSAESLRKFAVLTGKIIKAGALDFAAFSARIAEMVSPRILEALQPHLRSTFDSEFAKYQAEQSEAAAAAANVTAEPEQTQTTTQTVAEPDNSETPTDPATAESLPEEQAEPNPPPSSEPTSEPDVTSIKNASVDEQRAVRGRDPMQGAPAQSQQQWLDAATARIAARPEWTGELLARLATDAFNLSPLEIAGLQIHRRRLVNAYNESANELYAAHQANDQPGMIAAQARLDAMDVELDRMEEATKAAGREWGRSGVARQIALAADFSLAGMTRRARVANGGAPLTDQQRQQIEDWDRRYRDADSRVDSEERESEYDRSHTQARRRAGRRPRAATRPRPDSSLGDNVDLNNPSSVANLAKQLQRMFVEAGMTDKVEVLNAVHEAIQEFVPGMTRDETMDAMSGYGKYKELSKAEVDVKIRELNGIYQQLAKLRDMQNRKVPLKTGQERREVSDEERRLIAQVNEMKKQGEREGWYVITDPGKQARSTLAATKKALLNRIYDLTDEIQKREKNVKEKKDPITDTELVALRKLRDQMRSQHDEIFGRPELTDAQKIALAEKALDKAIKALEDDISKGKIYPDHTGEKSAWSPAIAAKKARLQALRDQRQELRDIANPKLTPEERANLTYARVLSKQIADYQQRLANGDFSPKPKPKPRNLTPALVKALADRDKVKLEFRTAQSKWKRDHRTKAEIAKDWAHEAWNLTRDLQTTGEASFTLRQGLLYAASHPLKFVQAVAKSFAVATAWDNETELLKKSNEIKNRPNAISGLYARAKVPFSDSVSPKTGQEELLLGRWAEKIPLLGRAIKRNAMAGDAFLNIARADMFDAMASFWGSNPDSLTDAEAKQFGSAAGVFTGKGDFGNVGRTSTILNNLLFSFPFTLSRFQVVLGQPLMGGTMRTRTAIASEYVRAAMGLSVFYAAIQFALTAASDDDDELPEIDFNPLSSDFMKIRIGKTRLDPLAGLQQVVVFLTRQIRNKKTSSAGVTVPLGGMSGRADDARDVVNNFAWSKAHPTIGMYFNQRTGQDMAGNEVTADELPQSFIPMSYPGMADAVREAGLPRGLVMDALSFAGANVSTYGASTHQKNMAVAMKAADTMIAEDKSESKTGAMKGKVKSEFTGKNLAEAKQNDEIIRSARERLDKVAPSFQEQANLLREAYYLKHGRLTQSFFDGLDRLPAFQKASPAFQNTAYKNWTRDTDKQWVKRRSELDQMRQKSSSQ